MSVFRKLISFITGHAPEKMNIKDQPFFYTGNDRAMVLESVKLILTKGTFLMTRFAPEFSHDLFLFNGQYVEIRLSQNDEVPVTIVILSGNSPEIEAYLDLIRINELILS